MNPLAKQIDARMKALSLSIMDLENKSGVKPHGVRNIITGKSKNPSAVNLQAISDVLGCSVKDLLNPPAVLQSEEEQPSLETLLQRKHVSSTLMEECAQFIEIELRKTRKTITTAQFLTCVREVYLHSLQDKAVNKDFAEWFVALMGE